MAILRSIKVFFRLEKWRSYQNLVSHFDRRKPWVKYALAASLFVLLVWAPWQNRDLWSYFSTRMKIGRLEAEVEQLREQYHADSLHLEQIKTSKNNTEHIAREDYLMRREGEKIFLIKKGE